MIQNLSLYHSLPFVLRQIFLLNLELADLSRLASQSAVGSSCFHFPILGLQTWTDGPCVLHGC